MGRGPPRRNELKLGLLFVALIITSASIYLHSKVEGQVAAEFTAFDPPKLRGTNLCYDVEIRNVGNVPFRPPWSGTAFFGVELLTSGAWVEYPHHGFTTIIGVGTGDKPCPSLQTGRAQLRHPAFRLVVSFLRLARFASG